MKVGEKQRRHGRVIDVYFEPIFRLHNAHGIDLVGCRTIASGDARRNTSRYRVNKSADGVLRDGSPFCQPFAKVSRPYEAGAEFANGVQ